MRLPMIVIFALYFVIPVQAEDGPAVPPEVQVMFPLNNDSCYAARMAAQEMKPGQKLTDFYLYRLYDPNPALEEVQFTREQAIAYFSKPESANWVDAAARFSDKPFLYTNSLACWVSAEENRQVFCGVECDGGSFRLDGTDKGLRMRFSEGGGLSLNQSCGEPGDDGNDRWMTGTEAGGSVVLQKQPAQDCAVIDRAAHPKFADDPVSLRERIATLGWRCLSRAYDKAHMAKHPGQKVTAMAVSIKGKAKTRIPEGEYPETLLDVALSFKLRDGKIKTRDVQCRASQYEFVCEGGFRLRRRDASSAWLVAGEYTDNDNPPIVLDSQLGTDDVLFRLDAGVKKNCEPH